jgi:hypothetical protein
MAVRELKKEKTVVHKNHISVLSQYASKVLEIFCCLVLEKIKDKSFGHLLIVKILPVILFKLLVAKEGGLSRAGGEELSLCKESGKLIDWC